MRPAESGPMVKAGAVAAKLLGRLGIRLGRNRIEGFVDHVRAGEIIGWACDPARPNRRVLIVASAEGKVVAEALADLPRKDLINLGKGDGRHGFRLRIPGDMSEAERRSIRVEASAQPRNVLLQRGVVSFVPPAEPIEAETHSAGVNIQAGFLERWSGADISGWACDPANPTASIQVDVFDGEKFLGSAPCDQDRPQLQKSGAPQGAKGFLFQLSDPASLGSGEGLRIRITGSRIDLRRSKSFPGSMRSLEADPAEAGFAFDATEIVPGEVSLDDSVVTAVPSVEARKKASGVAFLICGEGSDTMVATTLASCKRQTWTDTEFMRVEPGAAEEQRPGLELLLASRSTAVFLYPGQEIDPDLAKVIAQARRPFDVCTWSLDHRMASRDPDISALLGGGFAGALAIRCSALNHFEGDLAGTLTRGDLGALAGWAARSGQRWTSLAGQLSTPVPVRRHDAPLAPAAAPQRVTLAVWSGWKQSERGALRALLSGCSGLQVEVLVPSGVSVEEVEALAPNHLGSLAIKRIDLPHDLGDGLVWRLMSQAATGQVVVLCHGDVRLKRPEALSQICAWAMAPRIGAVTIEIQSAKRGSLAGLAIVKGANGLEVVNGNQASAGGHSRTITAAPAAFLAVSRESLVAAGGFDSERLPRALADVDLSLRLHRIGRVSILLAGAAAIADDEFVAQWSRQFVAPADQSVLGEDMAEFLRIGTPAPGSESSE